MTPRTNFLIENPKMIDALAVRNGLPFRELDDFRQEVILQSIMEPDEYNSTLGKLSTYAGNFIRMRALNYLKKMGRRPVLSDDLSSVPDTSDVMAD